MYTQHSFCLPSRELSRIPPWEKGNHLAKYLWKGVYVISCYFQGGYPSQVQECCFFSPPFALRIQIPPNSCRIDGFNHIPIGNTKSPCAIGNTSSLLFFFHCRVSFRVCSMKILFWNFIISCTIIMFVIEFVHKVTQCYYHFGWVFPIPAAV